MDKTEYETHYKSEKENWWFLARRKLILKFISNTLSKNGGTRMLDIGCGTGANLVEFSRVGRVTGIDISNDALKFCSVNTKNKVEEIPLTRASALNLPFEDGCFDCILALDVIEHLDDDLAALREFNRVLVEGGMMITSVPAFNFLWSSHDKFLHHFRRYSKKDLADKLTNADFEIEKISYWNFSIFPFVTLYRKIFGGSNTKGELSLVPNFLNKLLENILDFETQIIERHSLPFGVTLVCISRK